MRRWRLTDDPAPRVARVLSGRVDDPVVARVGVLRRAHTGRGTSSSPKIGGPASRGALRTEPPGTENDAR